MEAMAFVAAQAFITAAQLFLLMRDYRRPIMRIFTALFFIETDYVTTLFVPYLLDCERGWILCMAAFRHTLKPACTAAKHCSVNFLLPAHTHPDDITRRRIA